MPNTNPNDYVATTHLPDDADKADYLGGVSLNDQESNFRKAFAVVGALISDGFIKVDFSDKDWYQRFELAVIDVATTLNIVS